MSATVNAINWPNGGAGRPGVVYRSGPDTTILNLLGGSLSLGSLDELELRLASGRTFRHGSQLSSRPVLQATIGRFTV
jgi:hypothetical protein